MQVDVEALRLEDVLADAPHVLLEEDVHVPHHGVAPPVGRRGVAKVGASVAEEELRQGEEGREAAAHPVGPEPRDDLAGRARVGDVEEQVPQLGGVARRGGALEHPLGGEERRLQRPVQGRVGRGRGPFLPVSGSSLSDPSSNASPTASRFRTRRIRERD